MGISEAESGFIHCSCFEGLGRSVGLGIELDGAVVGCFSTNSPSDGPERDTCVLPDQETPVALSGLTRLGKSHDPKVFPLDTFKGCYKATCTASRIPQGPREI